MCANWGVKAHLDCPNPNLVPFYGKTAHVEPHHHALHLFTWFFCNHIFLLQQHHTTQNYAIWWSGWSALKILCWKVGFTPRTIGHVAALFRFQAQVQFKHQVNSYIWMLLSKRAKWGQRAQFTFYDTRIRVCDTNIDTIDTLYDTKIEFSDTVTIFFNTPTLIIDRNMIQILM